AGAAAAEDVALAGLGLEPLAPTARFGLQDVTKPAKSDTPQPKTRFVARPGWGRGQTGPGLGGGEARPGQAWDRARPLALAALGLRLDLALQRALHHVVQRRRHTNARSHAAHRAYLRIQLIRQPIADIALHRAGRGIRLLIGKRHRL